jgi:transposase
VIEARQPVGREPHDVRGATDARAAELKGKRFVPVRGAAKRTAEDEAQIAALRRVGYKVGRAWALKEAARAIWECSTPENALSVFQKWYRWAMRSKLEPM